MFGGCVHGASHAYKEQASDRRDSFLSHPTVGEAGIHIGQTVFSQIYRGIFHLPDHVLQVSTQLIHKLWIVRLLGVLNVRYATRLCVWAVGEWAILFGAMLF